MKHETRETLIEVAWILGFFAVVMLCYYGP